MVFIEENLQLIKYEPDILVYRFKVSIWLFIHFQLNMLTEFLFIYNHFGT